MSDSDTKIVGEPPGEGPILYGGATFKPLRGKISKKGGGFQLKPIKESLVQAGLIKEEDVVDLAQTEPNTAPETPEQTSFDQPPLDANPAPVEADPEKPKRNVKARLPTAVEQMMGITPAAKPRDPLDTPDETGFTPRMRAWMAHPGFGSLIDILAHQRPMGSRMETRMLNSHVYPLASEIDGISMTEDRRGNIIVDLGDNSAGVLWSCHTDTVHCDREEGRQKVLITQNGFLKLPVNSGHTCLGADDGTGVWLMIHMIRGGIPGRYVFHYGEERGCVGSRWLLENTPEVLAGINFAIAFDRQGFSDIVTVQGGRRCCSTAFVDSIAPMLPDGYKGHPGVWTDTGVYVNVVPECTNLSVGYNGQHGSGEVQNLPHLYNLLECLLRFDASRLVVGRDPVKQREDEAREAEERAKFKTQSWRGHFQGTQTGAAFIRRPPAFLEAASPQDKAIIMRMARLSFGWSGLRPAEREVALQILGKHAIKKFGLVMDYVDDLDRWLGRQAITSATTTSGSTVALSGSTGTPKTVGLGNVTNFSDVGYTDYSDYDDDPIESFSDRIPPEPRSMLELVRNYPNEVSDVLEQEGSDVRDLWRKIRQMLGVGDNLQ